MKVKNFDKERASSQLTNVESPRFISTLKRALEVMFTAVDKEGTGKLTYEQFHNAFSTLSYGLNDNDVNMLISMADEDENELIDWRQFLGIGIQMIKTIYSRNIAKKTEKTTDKAPNPNILETIYSREIDHTVKLLNYKFKVSKSRQGETVSLDSFKRIVR